MSRRYVVAGARKSDWDLLLLTDPPARELIDLVHLEFSVFPCPECGQDMIMHVALAAEAKRRGWLTACLPCICRAKNIPYPDHNLPPLA